ncbi:RagB/SusD family nutrient uptake outer membrane protein [Chitinophaga alhagiae]|uniref:RagB/SusD family nutrient uptake outer membrane protein n=1 Tax=Chitinophaga alhagiae TaxID=2203219 RepID=UPI000E5C0B6E|nr:RagB/SusD family nutrient uptake outer membrane protein [Chitinophaga alhagiae]
MKIKHIIPLVCLLSGATACKKFLDTKPLDVLAPANYYTTEDHLRYGLAGVYDILGKAPLYAYSMTVKLATEADEGYYMRATQINGPQLYNFTSSDPEILNLWTTLYQGISRANALLENVGKPVMDETVRGHIKGEALFLRAYYYFLLVSNFGDVPLILNTVSSVLGNDVARSPAADVYEQITKDMKEAEQLVQTASQAAIGGRISQSAVRGVLARVYLYWAGYPLMNTAKYQDARDWAKKVMDDAEAGHQLNPSFSQVFVNYAQDKYDIKESIWEVEFSAKGNTRELGQIGSWIGITSSNATIGTAYGFIGVTDHLYRSYEPGDLRRDRAIANFSYTAAGAKTFHAATVPGYNRTVGKWRREEELVNPRPNQSTPQNLALLRYSDVLLMFAEAENEVNGSPSQAAIDAVNEVRRRAWSTGVKAITILSGGSGYTSAPAVTFSGGNGSGAAATATVTDGQVSAIVLDPDAITGTAMGQGYSTPPVITIAGGGGSDATASASIYAVEDADIPALDKAGFLKLIQAERSRELCFEGMRKYDLIRWNIFVSTLKEVASEFTEDAPANLKYGALSFNNAQSRNELFPIPITELGLNKLLVQNPGW